MLEKLACIGLDSKEIELHSLQSGGASAAANVGVPDRWFKFHSGCGCIRILRLATLKTS